MADLQSGEENIGAVSPNRSFWASHSGFRKFIEVVLCTIFYWISIGLFAILYTYLFVHPTQQNEPTAIGSSVILGALFGNVAFVWLYVWLLEARKHRKEAGIPSTLVHRSILLLPFVLLGFLCFTLFLPIFGLGVVYATGLFVLFWVFAWPLAMLFAIIWRTSTSPIVQLGKKISRIHQSLTVLYGGLLYFALFWFPFLYLVPMSIEFFYGVFDPGNFPFNIPIFFTFAPVWISDITYFIFGPIVFLSLPKRTLSRIFEGEMVSFNTHKQWYLFGIYVASLILSALIYFVFLWR